MLKKVTGSNVTPSEMKKALTISAIYNLGSKRVADNLFEDKSLMDSLLNGSDIGYSNEINRYYDKYNKANRGDKTNEFIAKNIVSSENNTRNPLDVKIISKSTDGNNLVPQNPRTSFFTRVKRALEAAKNSAPSGYGRWEDGGQL